MRRVVIVFLVIGVVGWLMWLWKASPAPHTAAPVTGPDSARAGLRASRLFFAAPDGDSLVSESRELPDAAGLHERVEVLVRELDRGPTAGGVAALPAGTALLHVFLDDRGLMTVNLSGAFRGNFQGGAGAEYLAIASLVRTLGANVPGVKRVLLICAGAPLATLGGHLPLDRPLDVSDFP